MIELALQAVANQSFSVQLDDSRYTLTFKEANGGMCLDVTRDEVEILRGSRVLAGEPLLPFDYLQDGNFVLLTQDDAIPYYTEFGITQTLVYVSADEIAAVAGT